MARNVMPTLNQIIHAQNGTITAQPESQESMVASLWRHDSCRWTDQEN